MRVKIAGNAGFSNYRDFRHQEYGRFDYTPDDCLALHENVERFVLPLVAKMDADRRARMGFDSLRPWDLAPDPDGDQCHDDQLDRAKQPGAGGGRASTHGNALEAGGGIGHGRLRFRPRDFAQFLLRVSVVP